MQLHDCNGMHFSCPLILPPYTSSFPHAAIPAPRRFIKDDYLQQNSYTKYDKYCPFYKSVEMMRNICTFHRLATAGVEKTAGGNAEGQKITFNVIKQRMSDTLYKITSQKFEDPGTAGTATPICITMLVAGPCVGCSTPVAVCVATVLRSVCGWRHLNI